jgi:uncharacterized membrane protein YccC
MASHGWTSETWDRVVASDPGLQRLRMALSAAAAMATALGVEYEFGMVTHAGAKGVLVAMLLGTVIAMMGSMALTGTQAWPKVRTAVLFPVAIGAGMLPGTMVAGHAHWMLAVFVVVMFVAVFIRRFGMPYFFYGFMIWMGYFFAVFLNARLSDLPALLAAVAVSTVWVLLLSVTVLRTNPRRTLGRVRRAFDARARAVARVCADLLETGPADERARARTRRKLHSRQLRLAETALIIEGWSGEEDALPQGWSAPALRRRLLEAHAAIDELATAAESLDLADGRLAAEAARIAGHLARREYRTAEQLSRALLALDQVRAQDLGPQSDHDCYAQHLANAALEFTALAARPDEPPDADDAEEFSPAVTLALGVLPGSPAVADDVAARGGWNPLSRMSLTSRQAVQVAVAGTLAIIIGRQVSETRYYWALIAAFIAFTGTATRSETFIKAGNRVLGTLLGLGAGVGLVHLTAGHTMWVLVAIIASMSCGFYLVNVSYACMIFFVTIMVSQLYSVLHEFSADLLVLRLEETAVGAAIGIAVALLVLPTSTRDTVHAARTQYFTALADLLRVTAARLNGERPEPVPVSIEPSDPDDPDDDEPAGSTDLDALIRALDLRLRQLALVARPLTRSMGRPLIWRNTPRVVRHRLTLHADLNRQIRALARNSRRSPGHEQDAELADATTALADAATALAANVPDSRRPAAEVARPLATAEALLLSRQPTDATGLLPPMTRLRWLLNELAVQSPAIPSATTPPPARQVRELVFVGAHADPRASGLPAQEPWLASNAGGNGNGSALGAGIRGHVRGGAGGPLPGAVITLVDASGRQLGRATSGEDGSYALGVPSAGSYVLIATADGHQPQAAAAVVGNEPLFQELALSGTSGLAGVVRSAATGATIAAATIVVTDFRGEVVGSTETDRNGVFSIKDLASGTVTLVVSANGHRPNALPIEVGGTGTTRREVELQVAGRLRGTVRAGAEKRPLSDARVTVVDATGALVATTTTGPDGEYTFTGLDTGEYTVTASAYAPATATTTLDGTDETRFDLKLGHPGE